MERIPPHNDEAEKSVLGSALLNKDALFDAVELLTEDDFYSEIHKEIFAAIKELYRRSSPVDTLTVSEEIKKRNSLEPISRPWQRKCRPRQTPRNTRRSWLRKRRCAD